jgi:predicted nucleic acid-binding protein
MALYLDSSALVKLVAVEAESDELDTFVNDREIVSSELARTEVMRAVSRRYEGLVESAEDFLEDLSLMPIDRLVTRAAAWVRPWTIRSLDAIHLASAKMLNPGLEALVTYDRRMVEAGRLAGLPVLSPGDKPRE